MLLFELSFAIYEFETDLTVFEAENLHSLRRWIGEKSSVVFVVEVCYLRFLEMK